MNEPKPEKGKEYKVAPAANVRPMPAYSRVSNSPPLSPPAEPSLRSYSGQSALGTPLWPRPRSPARHGSPANPPSHPELLDLLTDEFVAHHFDVKWLLREFALTETYQRSSEFQQASSISRRIGIWSPH